MIADLSPNYLHAQYLDAMGIQVWLRRKPFSGFPNTSLGDVAATCLPTEQPQPINQATPAIESSAIGETAVLAGEVIKVPTSLSTEASQPVTPPRQAVLPPGETTPLTTVLSSLTPPLADDLPAISLLDWMPLKQRVANCTVCELHQKRTQTVFGVGNQQADWMFIGEAPGEEEDTQGEPFVGIAGQLLTAMLKAIGLTREEVYITNVVKCRPPANRNPKVEEIVHCNSFLQRQIDLVQPKLIVALGAVATHHLLETTTKISDLRGKRFEYKGIPLIPIYHPAYLLRRPIEKRKAWHDLQILRKTFTEITETV